MEKRSKFLPLFMILLIGVVANVFAETTAAGAFKEELFTETENYVVPVLLLITIAASAIAYMQTKDWTKTLVAGAITGGLLGGATSLVSLFTEYNFSG